MGLIDLARSKLGIGPEVPDATARVRALDDISARIVRNRAATQAFRNDLPAATFRSPDAAAKQCHELTQLESEHDGLVATRKEIEREIAEAAAREQAARSESAWKVSTTHGDAVHARATAVDNAVATLASAIRELRTDIVAFENSLPMRAADYDSVLQRTGASLAIDALKARLLPSQSVMTIPSLRALAEVETMVALRARPKRGDEAA
ncbi:MAG: hypothetical protein ACLQAT_20110 [Candidatus Binataceae bacterium]